MRRLLALALALTLTACASPAVQRPLAPAASFQGPRLEPQAFVSFDGARLGLTRWDAEGGEPWAVIVGVHGMNDYANAFHLAGPSWARQGITTYAYDQRGFGRSPQRGVWGGEALMTEDLRTIVALARQRHPRALIAVAGESLGGSVAIAAFASDRPPVADRLILLAPGVWGWSNQPLTYKAALWIATRMAPSKVFTPPSWVTAKAHASDNVEELRAMGRDPMMIWGARTDALYGLVQIMEHAWRRIGQVRAPTLYLYGDHDQIIPKTPTYQAASRLPGARTGFYARGWHLLLRDNQAPVVWADVAAWLKAPAAPLPSGAPPIPSGKPAPARVVASGGGA
jgi:alpha-beta hydrolase superfamily lysophospholipase